MDYYCCWYWLDNKPVATFETFFVVGWPVVIANADEFANFVLIFGAPSTVNDDCGYDYGYGYDYDYGYGCDRECCDYDLDCDAAIDLVVQQLLQLLQPLPLTHMTMFGLRFVAELNFDYFVDFVWNVVTPMMMMLMTTSTMMTNSAYYL